MKKFIGLLACLMLMVCGFSQTTYKLGDLYNKDGIMGIVYKVSEDGQHGMMMSIFRYEGAWTANKKYTGIAKAYNTSDGKENMKIVEQAIIDNDLSWDDFPVFKYAKDLGEGWYIPSAKELVEIMKFLMGNNDFFNRMGNNDFFNRCILSTDLSMRDYVDNNIFSQDIVKTAKNPCTGKIGGERLTFNKAYTAFGSTKIIYYWDCYPMWSSTVYIESDPIYGEGACFIAYSNTINPRSSLIKYDKITSSFSLLIYPPFSKKIFIYNDCGARAIREF